MVKLSSITVALCLCIHTASGFSPYPSSLQSSHKVNAHGKGASLTPLLSSLDGPPSPDAGLSSPSGPGIPVVVTGNNLDLTPSLHSHVTAKIQSALSRYPNLNAPSIDVHLSVNRNPRCSSPHRAEAVLRVGKWGVIRSMREGADMYSCVDDVAQSVARKINKFKQRNRRGLHVDKGYIADGINIEEEDEYEEDPNIYTDDGSPTISKIKSFDLSTPMSVSEAVFALDYIDHDFYVFRDKETKEVSVVYKRNGGGVGLIQPADD